MSYKHFSNVLSGSVDRCTLVKDATNWKKAFHAFCLHMDDSGKLAALSEKGRTETRGVNERKNMHESST